MRIRNQDTQTRDRSIMQNLDGDLTHAALSNWQNQ